VYEGRETIKSMSVASYKNVLESIKQCSSSETRYNSKCENIKRSHIRAFKEKHMNDRHWQ